MVILHFLPTILWLRSWAVFNWCPQLIRIFIDITFSSFLPDFCDLSLALLASLLAPLASLLAPIAHMFTLEVAVSLTVIVFPQLVIVFLYVGNCLSTFTFIFTVQSLFLFKLMLLPFLLVPGLKIVIKDFLVPSQLIFTTNFLKSDDFVRFYDHLYVRAFKERVWKDQKT